MTMRMLARMGLIMIASSCGASAFSLSCSLPMNSRLQHAKNSLRMGYPDGMSYSAIPSAPPPLQWTKPSTRVRKAYFPSESLPAVSERRGQTRIFLDTAELMSYRYSNMLRSISDDAFRFPPCPPRA